MMQLADDIYVEIWRDATKWAIEPDNFAAAAEWRMLKEGYYVPEGRIFPMGDNRDNSHDARYFGPVRLEKVLGKGLFRYWPHRPHRRGQVEEMIGSVERYSPATGKKRAGRIRGTRAARHPDRPRPLPRRIAPGRLHLPHRVGFNGANAAPGRPGHRQQHYLRPARAIHGFTASRAADYQNGVTSSSSSLHSSRAPSLAARILEPLANFFSLQKGDPPQGPVRGTRERLHRQAGDRDPGRLRCELSSFEAALKPRGGTDFVPEKQLIPRHYVIQTDLDARGWSSTYPFSGNSEEITLGDDQYFVLGDNRTESSDSRSWGPVTQDRIVGKVIYRYWPPRSLGTP